MGLAMISGFVVFGIFYALRFSPELWVDIAERKAESVKWRASMSFAYASVLFLTGTLLIGPYYVLSNRPIPANSFLRRDIAIWGGVLALAHMLIAMFVHVDGLRFWQSFITGWPSWDNLLPLKFNKIGLANYIGLIQLSIIILLLFLSNNRALRKFGTKRWKNLQRLNYLAFSSIAIYGYLYHLIEQRLLSFRLRFYAIVLSVVAVQLFGFYRVRQRRHHRSERNIAIEQQSSTS